MPLDFDAITRASISRANRWHDGDFHNWTVLEWAGAMAGEAGEAANVAKKIRRAEQRIRGNRETPVELLAKLGKECADVVLYMVLLCAYYDLDLESHIVQVFNEKSVAMDFPERIGFFEGGSK